MFQQSGCVLPIPEFLQTACMGCTQDLNAAAHQICQRLRLLFASDFVCSDHLGRYASQQHPDTFCLRRSVQHFCPDSYVHLSNPLPAGRQFRPFIGNSYLKHQFIRTAPQQISEQSRFAGPRWGNNQCMINSLPLFQIGEYKLGTSLYFMGHTDDQRGNISQCPDCAFFHDRPARYSNPVASRTVRNPCPNCSS